MFSQNKMKYLSFMNKVEDCPEPPKYKWSPNDICMIAKMCKKPIVRTIHRLWTSPVKQVECKCDGKYGLRCNSSYCGLDKRACNGLSLNKKMNISRKVKKCDQY